MLGHNGLSGSEVLVCKLADLVLERFIPLQNIGGNTLFLEERNLCASSKILSTVNGYNVIYYCTRWPYLVQHHLSTGSLSPAIDICSLYGRYQEASSLVHYIFSCCIRRLVCRCIWFIFFLHYFSLLLIVLFGATYMIVPLCACRNQGLIFRRDADQWSVRDEDQVQY